VQLEDTSQFVLGPDDQIKIWSLGMEEISDKPVRIDPSGDIDLPIIGKIHAGGLTVGQLRARLVDRFGSEVQKPQVSIEIVEFGSQPVSVMGSVNRPGVVQLRGRKTLSEVISLVEGLSQNAGPHIHISRRLQAGTIPLSNAKTDPSGKFSVAEVQVRNLLAGTNPAENILIYPYDVITVPAAEMVFVMGEVRKPGPVALNDREGISVLQAVSMAEGFGPAPAPQAAKIVRIVPGTKARQEIPVDLRKVLAGKAEDIGLRSNDILVIPPSGSKKAAVRVLEAAVQTVTGVIIWRRP
jgi:polysaccharide export outer membrane protein